ncbi:MAG: DUF4136 domain-containing protein [Cyclobacteriaceae bacterium]
MRYLFLLTAFVFTAATSFAQDNKEVIFKENPDAALDQFNSYYFGNNMIDIEENEWYTFGRLHSKMVQNSIVHEFDTYGYELAPEKPDVLVNYMIFDKEYNDKYGSYKDAYIVEEGEVDENILLQLEDGSLVVSIINPENGKTAWVGYVPDAIDPNDGLRQQQIDIRASIADVLEAYIGSANFDESSY